MLRGKNIAEPKGKPGILLRGMGGIREWLSFYFKSPITAPEIYPEHDLFIQPAELKNTLRYMMESYQVTRLGIEQYEE